MLRSSVLHNMCICLILTNPSFLEPPLASLSLPLFTPDGFFSLPFSNYMLHKPPSLFRAARWSTRRDPSLQLCNPRGRTKTKSGDLAVLDVSLLFFQRTRNRQSKKGIYFFPHKRIDHLCLPGPPLLFEPCYLPPSRGGGLRVLWGSGGGMSVQPKFTPFPFWFLRVSYVRDEHVLMDP